MQLLLLIFIGIIISWQTIVIMGDEIPTCQPQDFHYEFTECDQYGGRWRVSVPYPGRCTGGAPNAPIRINNCTTACEAGRFLNISSLNCETCLPGTYSLGGGEVYDTWDKLPNGFRVIHENSQSPFREMLPFHVDTPYVNCSQFGWIPHGDFIYSQSASCTSVLVYTAKLVKSGRLIYTYQYTDDSIVFLFQVQNDQCLPVDEVEQSRWPPPTEEGKWRTLTVPLKAGLNILQWKTIGMFADRTKKKASVLIKTIKITGLAYTSGCVLCPNGTFSSGESAFCRDCSINTFSHRGSSRCTKCNPNQYSGQGAASCKRKLPCMEKDYYLIYDQCDSHKQTTLHYKWFQPKICDDSAPGSVSLPPSKYEVSCPRCNPGMHYSNSTGCVFCPTNHFSNGQNECTRCPPSTTPDYRYEFYIWNSMPPTMESSCLSLTDGGCRSQNGWQVATDYIHSSLGNDNDAYLILEMRVEGFRTSEAVLNGHALEVARLSFAFELICIGSCEFVFMQESSIRGVTIIKSWTGSQLLQQYTYIITQNTSYVFTWAFQKQTSLEELTKENGFRKFSTDDDKAKIIWVNLTNTIDGGASQCETCPKGSENNRCISCPAGNYIDDNSTECRKCPPNTIPYNMKTCQPCGFGLKSENGQICYSDCTIEASEGTNRSYNFSNLVGFHQVFGRKLFTSSGTEFSHVYNISLCGEMGQHRTSCINNITSHGFQKDPGVYHSTICRSTLIPMEDMNSVTNLAAQSVSLGDHLIGITTSSMLANISIIEEFLNPGEDELHFFYMSPITTRSCPNGRSSTITLRCNKTQTGNGSILLPTSCPDGTCDGCSFHLVWLSLYACPICSDNELEVVAGDCLNGIQSIYYIAPNECRLPVSLEGIRNKSRQCSSIPQELQIIIGTVTVIGFLLLLLVCYFWKKNKKLAYNYKKLVQSTTVKEEELIPAESCALHDDEEDHFDSIQFEESKHKVFLRKLKSMSGSKDDKQLPFESLQLT